MSRPTVAAIIPTYNARAFVVRGLESVFAQSLPIDEVVLADDGSSDGTADFVEERYAGRVRVLRLPRHNVGRARNRAVEATRADWVAFLDADDVWMPEKNRRLLDYAVAHPEVAWISSDGAFVEEGRVLRPSWLSDYFQPLRPLHGDLYPLLAERCFVLISSMMVRRDAFVEAGGFRDDMPNALDWDLWFRLAARRPGAVVAEPLIHYFRTPGSLSTSRLPRLESNIALLERVAAGVPREDIHAQRRAASALTEFYWSLGLWRLREGEVERARDAFRRAAGRPGPVRMRVLSLAASILPARVALGLRGQPWARASVIGSQSSPGRIPLADGEAAPPAEATGT